MSIRFIFSLQWSGHWPSNDLVNNDCLGYSDASSLFSLRQIKKLKNYVRSGNRFGMFDSGIWKWIWIHISLRVLSWHWHTLKKSIFRLKFPPNLMIRPCHRRFNPITGLICNQPLAKFHNVDSRWTTDSNFKRFLV